MGRPGARRKARELALQVLYRMDINPCGPDQALEESLDDGRGDPRAADFARELVLGGFARRDEIDRVIAAASSKWGIGRMAVVDRNILRLAVYELLAAPKTPPRVVLDEAIELAKSFGGEESANFVNGVLDRIMSDLSGKDPGRDS